MLHLWCKHALRDQFLLTGNPDTVARRGAAKPAYFKGAHDEQDDKCDERQRAACAGSDAEFVVKLWVQIKSPHLFQSECCDLRSDSDQGGPLGAAAGPRGSRGSRKVPLG